MINNSYLTGLLAVIILSACSCQSKKPSKKEAPDAPVNVQPAAILPSHADFSRLLEQAGVPATYFYDSALLQSQIVLPGKVAATDAFAQALASLFVHSDSIGTADDLYQVFTSQPESFGLSAHPTGEEVKKAILKEMQKDKGMTIYLLPENTETGSPEGVSLFPPEYGEKVQDYWIWYLKCNFFPGPVWMLVKRDGSRPAYHYGYM